MHLPQRLNGVYLGLDMRTLETRDAAFGASATDEASECRRSCEMDEDLQEGEGAR